MIPERLSQSIATCRTWLARRARSAPGRILRIRGRGARPELFMLEDRCLLTAGVYPVMSGSVQAYLVEGGRFTRAYLSSALANEAYSAMSSSHGSGGTLFSNTVQPVAQGPASPPQHDSQQVNLTSPVLTQKESPIAIGVDMSSLNISASSLAEAIEYASTQPAGSQRVLVMYANGGAEFPFTVMGYGTLAQDAASGNITLTFETSMEGGGSTPPPASSQPPGGVFVIVPPVPANPPPQTPATPDVNRPRAWWSQTSHPTSGVVMVLASPNGDVSSVPPAQASTPVALFLLQAPVAVASPSRPVGDITVLDRASDMFALAASASTSRITQRDLTALIAKNLTPRRNVPAEVDEIFSGNALASAPNETPLPAPTRSDLLAMTDKILEEYAPLPKKEDEPRSVISIQAVAACAAVQTAWLLLRHVAVSRSKSSPDDLEEKRGGWRWKTVR